MMLLGQRYQLRITWMTFELLKGREKKHGTWRAHALTLCESQTSVPAGSFE
jgi:hypothetical protein